MFTDCGKHWTDGRDYKESDEMGLPGKVLAESVLLSAWKLGLWSLHDAMVRLGDLQNPSQPISCIHLDVHIPHAHAHQGGPRAHHQPLS